LETGVAPPVDLEATHSSALEFVNLEELQAHALAMTKRRGYGRFQSRTAKCPDSETRGASLLPPKTKRRRRQSTKSTGNIVFGSFLYRIAENLLGSIKFH